MAGKRLVIVVHDTEDCSADVLLEEAVVKVANLIREGYTSGYEPYWQIEDA